MPHEPLLHVLLICALLFGGYTWVDRGRGAEVSPKKMKLLLAEFAQLNLPVEAKGK